MKIALLGYGKMGHEIERLLLETPSHSIQIIDSKTSDSDRITILSKCDVAIDFSTPQACVPNIISCFDCNIPVVSGTTGWLDNYKFVLDECIRKKGTFLWSANFSLGIYIFTQINKNLAKTMSKYTNYKIYIEETHHKHKKDFPSGTAISLANSIIKENSNVSSWVHESESIENSIVIKSNRFEEVPGIHSVKYISDMDIIEIKHIANNRSSFADGAIKAAEWLIGKNGIYTLDDFLNNQTH